MADITFRAGSKEYSLEDIWEWSGGAMGELGDNSDSIIQALSNLLIKSGHPAFLKLVMIYQNLHFGSIKELKIQNGLPVYITYDIKTELDAVIEVSKKLV